MDGVSMIGGQGNCASPLTFVISHILSLPFLSSTLTPQISVTHPCAPTHCHLLYFHGVQHETDWGTVPPNPKAFCLVISGTTTCQGLKFCLGPRRTVPLMSCRLGLCAW